jgi:hypothetical protein
MWQPLRCSVKLREEVFAVFSENALLLLERAKEVDKTLDALGAAPIARMDSVSMRMI